MPELRPESFDQFLTRRNELLAQLSSVNHSSDPGSAGFPLGYRLEQNYPNPFNPVTVIRYTLAESGEATLQVYNSAGQLVRTLSSGSQESGEHSATWDGKNDRGQEVATGVYFYRLQAHEGKFDQTRKMILMK